MIVQPFEPIALEAPKPISHAQAIGTQLSGDRRLALPARSEQNDPRATIQSRLATLAANNRLEGFPLLPRDTKTHALPTGEYHGLYRNFPDVALVRTRQR